MKRLSLLLLPALLFGTDLKTLLEVAPKNNNLIRAAKITQQSKIKELQSAKSNYYPTLDTNLFYQREDAPTPFYPGTTYGATAKINFDIYDGGQKSYTKRAKENELNAATHSYKADQNALALAITKEFFNLRSLYASLNAREEASTAVKAQLNRMQQFYAANLATSDDVDRLQSAYDRNIYAIESLKFKIFSLKSQLELQVGIKISKLEPSHFQKSLQTKSQLLDAIKTIHYNKLALKNLSETIDSYYYPNIKLQDKFTLYGYEDKPFFAGRPIELLDHQNTIMATLSLRLFDFNRLAEKKEALQLKADALNEKLLYKTKEQKMQLDLAKRGIQTAQLNIKSSQSALKAAKSALKTITKKYEAGIADNVSYLDALSSKTEAKALYEKSRNDLEIAYAIFYYYNAKNLEEYLK
jgi:outer membrane protein TolC